MPRPSLPHFVPTTPLSSLPGPDAGLTAIRLDYDALARLELDNETPPGAVANGSPRSVRSPSYASGKASDYDGRSECAESECTYVANSVLRSDPSEEDHMDKGCGVVEEDDDLSYSEGAGEDEEEIREILEELDSTTSSSTNRGARATPSDHGEEGTQPI